MSPRNLCTTLASALAFWAFVVPAFADVLPEPTVRRKPLVITPPPPPQGGNRDPVALSRRDPVIAKMLAQARGDKTPGQTGAARDETAVQVSLGGQCGFAGCSASTLVVFTFRSRGANTSTTSVLSLVTCPPTGAAACQVQPAEVRPVSPAAQQ